MLMNVRWHSLVVQMLTVSTPLALSLVPAMRDSEEMVSIVLVSTSALSRPMYLGLLEIHEGILTYFIPSDIDECLEQSPCDQSAMCTNTPGSFTCTCNDGYRGDGMTCTGQCFKVLLDLYT